MADRNHASVIDLTPRQRRVLERANHDLKGFVSHFEGEFLKEHMEPGAVVSCLAHLFLKRAAASAKLSALVDNRDPNREWFMENCARHFDDDLALVIDPPVTAV